MPAVTNVEAFKKVLQFCYSGKIQLTEEEVIDILQISHELQIEKVVEFCFAFLSDSLSTENALFYYNFSCGFPEAENFNDKCLKLIASKGLEVFKNAK